jgi:hypothetical protein
MIASAAGWVVEGCTFGPIVCRARLSQVLWRARCLPSYRQNGRDSEAARCAGLSRDRRPRLLPFRLLIQNIFLI